jgi:hypothetical protein
VNTTFLRGEVQLATKLPQQPLVFRLVDVLSTTELRNLLHPGFSMDVHITMLPEVAFKLFDRASACVRKKM